MKTCKHNHPGHNFSYKPILAVQTYSCTTIMKVRCKSLYKLFCFIHWNACFSICKVASEDCDMWNCKLFQFSAHFSSVSEANNWILTAVEAIHWSNVLSKFGTFSWTQCYLVICQNFISFFLAYNVVMSTVKNKLNAILLRPETRLTLPYAKIVKHLKFKYSF